MPQIVPKPPAWNNEAGDYADIQRQDFGRRSKFNQGSGESFSYADNDHDDDDDTQIDIDDWLGDPRSHTALSGVDTYDYTED